MHNALKLFLIALIVLVVGGCSGKTSDPVMPASDAGDVPPIANTGDGDLNHDLWFAGTINIDPDTMKADVVPDRNSDTHYKMADDVQVDIVVNSIDTVNWIVDVDVTIHNTLTEVGFDVRLIIYASSVGHRLLNPDDWTWHFDTMDGYPINPFKAYAKGEPSREFLIGAAHTENLLISIPGGNTSVEFAIDAS